MHAVVLSAMLALGATAAPLTPGNHTRTIQADGRDRTYLVHVPEKYDAKHPTPVVLILHGAYTDGPITALYSGMNATADKNNFIAVYPNGTGLRDAILFWNSGGRGLLTGTAKLPDDVAFLGKVIDDVSTSANVDAKRVFATGISNGGMMCYRLAGEMADRIAAIAPISGTLCQDNVKLKRPMPVLHFHGTDDKLVPYDGGKSAAQAALNCKSVDETIRTFAKLDGCPETPREESLPDKVDDGTTVKRFTYGPGKDGSEVVLVKIINGGHNWPGRPALGEVLGKSTQDISANDMIWEFFEKHPMKEWRARNDD